MVSRLGLELDVTVRSGVAGYGHLGVRRARIVPLRDTLIARLNRDARCARRQLLCYILLKVGKLNGKSR